jgi:hypothetical protein
MSDAYHVTVAQDRIIRYISEPSGGGKTLLATIPGG